MGNVSSIQIILLALLAAASGIDPYIGGWQLVRPAIAGFLAGIIMGDVQTGLMVGSSLQLLVLGVGTFGGASIPDYATGAIIGTALAVVSGQGVELAVGLSVPVGLFMIQLDVFARFCNIFFLHRIDKHVEKGQFHKINREAWFSIIPIGVSRALPVLLALFYGNDLVKALTTYAPTWLMNGLKVAGTVLPVVGIAILLRYLPVKRFVGYLFIGFLLAAYLKVPMMGISIAGLGAAFIHFKSLQELEEVKKRTVSVSQQEGEIEDDEC